jgi:hypothetical protein
MARPDGWDFRFNDWIEQARSTPFAWGVHDCCTFALGDFRAITLREPVGVEPWTSLLQAQRLLQKRPVAEWGEIWFGPSVEGWKMGARGDIALIDALRGTCGEETSHALAVVVGPRVCCPGPAGLEFAPLKSALRIWPVG